MVTGFWAFTHRTRKAELRKIFDSGRVILQSWLCWFLCSSWQVLLLLDTPIRVSLLSSKAAFTHYVCKKSSFLFYRPFFPFYGYENRHYSISIVAWKVGEIQMVCNYLKGEKKEKKTKMFGIGQGWSKLKTDITSEKSLFDKLYLHCFFGHLWFLITLFIDNLL